VVCVVGVVVGDRRRVGSSGHKQSRVCLCITVQISPALIATLRVLLLARFKGTARCISRTPIRLLWKLWISDVEVTAVAINAPHSIRRPGRLRLHQCLPADDKAGASMGCGEHPGVLSLARMHHASDSGHKTQRVLTTEQIGLLALRIIPVVTSTTFEVPS